MKQAIRNKYQKRQTLKQLSYIIINWRLNKFKVNIQEMMNKIYNIKTCYYLIKRKANAMILKNLIQKKKW